MAQLVRCGWLLKQTRRMFQLLTTPCRQHAGMLKQLGNFNADCPPDGAGGGGRRSCTCLSGMMVLMHHACRHYMRIAGEQSGTVVDAGHLYFELWARAHGIHFGLHRTKVDWYTG